MFCHFYSAYTGGGRLSNWLHLSVCPVNFTIYRLLNSTKKSVLVYLIETKVVLFCISSSFLLNIDIVCHFNTVNNSDTAEDGHIHGLWTRVHTSIRREASVALIRQSVMPTAWIRSYTSTIYESLLTVLQNTTGWRNSRRNCTL